MGSATGGARGARREGMSGAFLAEYMVLGGGGGEGRAAGKVEGEVWDRRRNGGGGLGGGTGV